MTIPNITPDVVEERIIRIRPDYLYERREEGENSRKFKIENVRFEHDPVWRERTFSLEKAAGATGIWFVVKWLFVLSQLSFYLGFYLKLSTVRF